MSQEELYEVFEEMRITDESGDPFVFEEIRTGESNGSPFSWKGTDYGKELQ